MKMYFAVGLGGAFGAMGRYYMSSLMMRFITIGFPLGTLAVNIVGSVAMGIIIEILALHGTLTQEWRAFVTVGFSGGFTTFSAFSLEVALMIERNDFAEAALYVGLSLLLCVGGLFLGLAMVRWVS